MGDIIDPLFNKYKFSSSISDVFLFNAATNSIYGRSDYQVLTAGAFDNQRILISIRGHHRQLSSTSSLRRDAIVDDGDVLASGATGGVVGAEALSRAVSDRYDDQRGPLKAADLEIPEWLNDANAGNPAANPVFTAGNADEGDVSHTHNDSAFSRHSTTGWKLRKGSASSSRYGSVSSLSVRSGVGDGEEMDDIDSIATPSPNDVLVGASVSGRAAFFTPGGIPSPDVASALFADAMGHAADASLGDSKTHIDLGLGNVESPEVARSAASGDRQGGSW